MRRSSFNLMLVKATPLIALIAALVIFGLLYGLLVQPKKVAVEVARAKASQLQAELARTAAPAARPAPPPVATPVGGADFAGAIRNLANSPEVGGVAGLAVESDAAGSSAVKVSFDAKYEQIGRFFWSLQRFPAKFELRSIEMKPAASSTPGLMRATILLSQP